jgi:predicted MFS family arabinose efflux permease
MTSSLDGRRQPGGALAQALITACVTGIVTSVTMVGPLLLDISRDLGISVAQAGLLAAAAAVPQALGSPFSGLLSDRLGRRPMIVFSLGSVGVLGFAAALAPSFAALCAIRFAAGLLGSLAPTSLMAAVGDLFPAGRRARAMGWFNMVDGSGGRRGPDASRGQWRGGPRTPRRPCRGG